MKSKKRSSRPQALLAMKITKILRASMIDMFSLFKKPKRRTFGYFLTSSEDKIFFVKKDPENRGRMVTCKPMFEKRCIRYDASR